MVGSLQREMTYLVRTCVIDTLNSPIDSIGPPGSVHFGVDSFHIYGCANSGTFAFKVNPSERDTSIHITITATGLSAGFTFTVINNGTSTPVGYLSGNTALIAPGHYVIYLTCTDNHCPLTTTTTFAYTIDILPVPEIREETITRPPALAIVRSCSLRRVVQENRGL